MKATVSKITKRIDTRKSKIPGIISYDVDNNYPGRIRDIVAGSSMGSTCREMYRKFIFGRGFQDVELSKKVINRWGMTMDGLLFKISDEFSYGAFALHFNFNALYEKTDISLIPIEHIRFTDEKHKTNPNQMAINKDWGTKEFDEKNTRFVHFYNPDPAIIDEQVKISGGWDQYNGQIMYCNPYGKGYPLAMFDSVLEDMQTDAQAKTFKFRNVTTNFMASHILFRTRSNSDENINVKTQDDEFDMNLTDFQGADNAMKIMSVELDSPDQFFKLEKVDQMNGDAIYQFTEQSTRNNIRQKFMIPPVLLMELSGRIGGTADEIIDATKSYNSTTDDERIFIEMVLKKAFTNFVDKSINENSNFYILPRTAIAKNDAQKNKDIQAILINGQLTKEQKKLILVNQYQIDSEDAEKMVNPNDTKTPMLIEQIGPNGMQSLTNILTNQEMTPEQKRGTLEILFGLTADQINKLVPNVSQP